MNDLLKLISKHSALPISTISTLRPYTVERPINLHPDTDLIKHDKHVDKEYVVEDKLDLHEEYPFLLKADLEEYGYRDDENFITDFNDGRGISYSLKSLDQRRAKIYLRGVLTGSYAEMDMDAECLVKIEAIEKEDYDALALHEALAIEGYLLHQEGNYKLAFFMYFSAVEAIVRSIIDKVKQGCTEEEANKLERSTLPEKVKVAGKHAFNTDKLISLPVWNDLTRLTKQCTADRNIIAHGLEGGSFSSEDAEMAAACYIVVQQVLLNGVSTMPDIVNIYKPKKAKREN
ncbi:hypothetical protein QM325_24585 [Pseudomonas putida]|uniref:hypothetical protein n=1 Tax=Pseudomonas sp. LAM2023 TaxID=2800477 RepID=UPI00190A827B|nr:hypothetical protein [Pseudomonas sp. LAM2023]EKT4505771.1 hypothetical protein [Pseudomonas putida]MDI9780936.1 hypothetical protein [Pseudomonas putida]